MLYGLNTVQTSITSTSANTTPEVSVANTDLTSTISTSANTTPAVSLANAEQTTTKQNCLVPVAGLPGVYIYKCMIKSTQF